MNSICCSRDYREEFMQSKNKIKIIYIDKSKIKLYVF